MKYSDFAIRQLVERLKFKALRTSVSKKIAGDMLEAAEVIEQLSVHGEWIAPTNGADSRNEWRECSRCGNLLDVHFSTALPKFCDECGAKMDATDSHVGRRTNRDWLNRMNSVDLVNWIKNEAAAMSDAELIKWMEEYYG